MISSHPSGRTSVFRSLLLFTPFLLLAAAALFALIDGMRADGRTAGGIVGSTVIGLVALLLAYQVVQSFRDLFAQVIETDGVVDRRWTRNEFFLFRNAYIFVQGNVFRLSPEQEIHVNMGDRVRVVHYPHTATVEALEVLDHVESESAVRV